MPTNGFRLFKIFGITVYLNWTWFLLAVYELQARKGVYQSFGWNVAELLSLFGIVLLHEFGHALACRSVGGKAERIVLWPFGGVAYVSPPMRPGAMLWSIVAGPLVNVILIPVTLPLMWLPGHSDLNTFLWTIAYINLALLIFNMLPIYPLDGGKILWSLLWFVMGLGRSLMVASVVGIVGAGALMLWAMSMRDIWLVAIALFAVFQAFAGFKNAQVIRRRETIPRRKGVACPNCGAAPPIGPFWVCSTCHAQFDAFDHPAACPGCGKPHRWNTCLDCGARAPFAAWGVPMPAGHVVISGVPQDPGS
jgi:Zn-dependent protease/DNA-directed RNA polymerase subunit RPC12/RpoP